MQRKRTALFCTIAITAVAILGISVTGQHCYAYTAIPREKIPADFPVDVRKQVERLYSHDVEEQARACYQLGQMGEKAVPAIPFLIGMLGTAYLFHPMSPDEAAAKALVKIGKPAVPQLLPCLTDEDPWVRERAVWILGKLKDPRAIDGLIAALRDDDSDVRWLAALALGELKDRRAVEPLITALSDAYQNVRKEAAGALGAIGDTRATAGLIPLLKDANWKIRVQAAEALETIKDPQAAVPLRNALQDSTWNVRSHAAAALGEMKDTASIDALVSSLNDVDAVVRDNAAEALKKITGKDLGQDPAAWKKWRETNKNNLSPLLKGLLTAD
jgi:HEAT repeat protein